MKTIVTQIPSRNAFLRGEDTLKIGYPWLTYGAIIAIESRVNKEMKVLEFGSGGSTIFWANNCKSVKSYETNPEWYNNVKQKTEHLKNVEIVLCDRRGMSTGLKSEPDDHYDIVLIDSDPKRSRRLDLANNAVFKLKTGGWLIIDNYLKFGMSDFDYSKWQVFTFDEFHYRGLGTRLCRKIS